MGEDTGEIYLQGFSTSLPEDVQLAMLHTLPGFEHAHIMRPATPSNMTASIRWSFCPPLNARPCAALRRGQFNGSSGYEEAAAQGLVAGINAALALRGREPLILSRSESYIGMLIDDLVTKGTNEPYRVMTSRSEYRLLLRQDNAHRRLTPIGYRVGLVGEARYAAVCQMEREIAAEKVRLEKTFLSPTDALAEFLTARGSTPPASGISMADLVRRPELDYARARPLWTKTVPPFPPRPSGKWRSS